MAEISFKARPAAEAVDYFQKKVVGGRFSFDWRDVRQEEHLTAFVVAKAATRDILADVHGALVQAQAEGWARQKFVDQLTPLLQAKGWWGKKDVTDPTTGEVVKAQLGSNRRLELIFDVNMRMANSAGRWERFARSADSIFLRYHHTPQERPRPWHLAWDGITLPMDHSFWRTHYCPNGWRCKCWINSVQRTAAEPTSQDKLDELGVDDEVEWKNKRTGVTEMVPKGIDPGFGYNVGQARLKGLEPAPMPEPQRDLVQGGRNPAALPPAPQPRALPAGAAVRPDLSSADAQTVFEAFSKVLGKGEGEVFIDKAQVPVVIGQRLFQAKTADGAVAGDKANLRGRAEFAEVLAATLRDPDEIWHSLQARIDGSSIFVRNYVAAFDAVEGERQWFVVTFHEVSGVDGRQAWWGATAFAPGKRGKPASQAQTTAKGARVGALVYQRK
ncbi:MAG TPA: PBECR2 nuclease fold domain-containing protein [Caulobacteraceae bacterium]|nr:PBECR2 nuclease fold domain-containing protein [Caulobacteraceae bacterium]